VYNVYTQSIITYLRQTSIGHNLIEYHPMSLGCQWQGLGCQLSSSFMICDSTTAFWSMNVSKKHKILDIKLVRTCNRSTIGPQKQLFAFDYT